MYSWYLLMPKVLAREHQDQSNPHSASIQKMGTGRGVGQECSVTVQYVCEAQMIQQRTQSTEWTEHTVLFPVCLLCHCGELRTMFTVLHRAK